MLFGLVSGIGRGMGILDVGGDNSRGRDNFGGECVVYHCNQCGLCGILVQKCMNRSSCHLLGE